MEHRDIDLVVTSQWIHSDFVTPDDGNQIVRWIIVPRHAFVPSIVDNKHISQFLSRICRTGSQTSAWVIIVPIHFKFLILLNHSWIN